MACRETLTVRTATIGDVNDIVACHQQSFVAGYTDSDPLIPNEAYETFVYGPSMWGESDGGSFAAWAEAHWGNTARNPAANTFFAVAERAGSVVGFVDAKMVDDRQGNLAALYALEQGTGIGSILMEHANAFVGEHTPMQLLVVRNTRAIDFYRKHGFEQTSRDLSAMSPPLLGKYSLQLMEMIRP